METLILQRHHFRAILFRVIESILSASAPPPELWDFLGEKFSLPHIDQIFEYIDKENDDVKVCFLRIIKVLTRIRKHNVPVYLNSFPGDISYRLLPKHVDKLIACAKSYGIRVQEEVCQIITNLACKEKILLSHHIDWIIHILRTSTNYRLEIIIAKARGFSDRLSSPHVDQILGLLDDTNLRVQQAGLEMLYQITDRLSNKDLEKIVSLLDSESTILKEHALMVLANINCKVSSDQVDKIISLLAIKDERLCQATAYTLKSGMKNSMSKQKDKILEAFNKIDYDIKYTSNFEHKHSEVYYSKFHLPTSTRFSKKQIGEIARLLSSPYSFKQKLGIELLADMENSLPNKYRTKIMNLLSKVKPSTIEVILRALPLIHSRPSVVDISRIINYLSSPHSVVRKAAADILVEFKNRLRTPHIIKMVNLLEDRNISIVNNTLTVLAKAPKEKVPKPAIAKIIAVLEIQEKCIISVGSQIGTFANMFEPEHIVKLLNYIKTGKPLLKMMVFEILEQMEQDALTTLLYEVIECLQSDIVAIRACATLCLWRKRHCLTEKHVEKLIESHKTNPAIPEIIGVISSLPLRHLIKHKNLFIKHLDYHSTGPELAFASLIILHRLADKLQPFQIKQVENLFHDSHLSSAYNFLKKTYQIHGLPQ